MSLQSFVQKLPQPLLSAAVWMGYKKNGHRLEGIHKKQQGRFWIYKINGIYLASQTLGWFVHYGHLLNEAHTIPLWHYKPKEGDVIVDLGSGIAEEAIVFSKLVGPSGQVHCMEANPNVYKILQEVVSLNNLQNVKTYQLALAETDGEIELEDDENSYLSSAQVSVPQSGRNVFTVKAQTLDSFISTNGIGRVDFLKCNIEGAERFLLDPKSKGLLSIPHLAISCHDFRFVQEGNPFFKTKELVITYLQENGYQTVTQKTGISFVDDWVYAEKEK